jgi:hypothetical protein
LWPLVGCEASAGRLELDGLDGPAWLSSGFRQESACLEEDGRLAILGKICRVEAVEKLELYIPHAEGQAKLRA